MIRARYGIAIVGLLGAIDLMPPAYAQTVDAKEAAAESKSLKDVDIEANEMQVVEDQKKVVFKGKVIGRRGAVTLTSDQLAVNYVETKQPNGESNTEVTFLDATGNIKIVTSRQTVTGQWAKMDVKANEITVGGKVKVVQGKTVISGEKLFVDLDTNRSEMTGGRVRGSFVPSQ